MRAASRRKFHVIYKTICTSTGRFYVGMHSTDNLDDSYLGSGVFLWRSIKKYGPENHRREILEHLPDRESLRLREEKIVDEKFLNDPMCMNLMRGGNGGREFRDPLTRGARIRAKLLGNTNATGKRTPRALESLRRSFDDPTRNTKISQSLTGKTASEETKATLSRVHTGVPLSAEHSQKISQGNTIAQKRPEVRERKRLAMLRYWEEKRKQGI